ncbi:MAG TPA: restriction endonuclease subunit S, partial [Allocoleopsis sp.]
HNQSYINDPTIIIGRKGSAGKVTYAHQGGWAIDTTFYVEIINFDKIALIFLFYVLKYLHLERYTITTAIPGINRNDLYNSIIPMPAIELQNKFLIFEEKTQISINRMSTALQESENLFNSLLQKAFKGEL